MDQRCVSSLWVFSKRISLSRDKINSYWMCELFALQDGQENDHQQTQKHCAKVSFGVVLNQKEVSSNQHQVVLLGWGCPKTWLSMCLERALDVNTVGIDAGAEGDGTQNTGIKWKATISAHLCMPRKIRFKWIKDRQTFILSCFIVQPILTKQKCTDSQKLVLSSPVSKTVLSQSCLDRLLLSRWLIWKISVSVPFTMLSLSTNIPDRRPWMNLANWAQTLQNETRSKHRKKLRTSHVCLRTVMKVPCWTDVGRRYLSLLI